MKKTMMVCVLVFVSVACSNSKKAEKKKITPQELKSDIKAMDDSLRFYYQQIKENKITDIHPNYYINAIQKNLDFYRKFPKNEYSPVCLDKVQQLYTQQKQYGLALSFCDTLLKKYPDYKGNAIVLLNAGSIADGILNDKNKVKKYYSKLLEDYPDIDRETREMVEFRLQHIDLTFDQMIELQMQKISQKK